MNSKASNFAALALFLLLSSSASAFNITKILSGYSDFSTFNNYLNQTKLSDQINSRQTITILAVSNGALGFLSGRSSDIVKKILSVHVILDYYDEQKLSKLSKDNETTLTTLYQSTGNAVNQQGFIKVSVDKSSKQVTLTSAARGASGGVKVVKSVTSQPYNISVIQVDNIIPVPGLDSNSPQTPPPSPPKQSPAPSPSNKKSDNSMAPSPSESGDAPSPSEDKDAPSLSPEADAPKADAPKADAPEPASADSPTESEPPTDSSGVSGSGVIGLGVLMGLIMSFFVAF